MAAQAAKGVIGLHRPL